MRRILILAFAASLPCLAAAAFATESPALTGQDFPTVNGTAPIPKDTTDDKRRSRNYPDQPPVIPHSVTGYQIDQGINKCLTCHSREYTGASQAPMISVTHFQDREGQTLGAVSPRRYFCTQCHVPQTDAPLKVDSLFQDIDTVIKGSRQGKEGK